MPLSPNHHARQASDGLPITPVSHDPVNHGGDPNPGPACCRLSRLLRPAMVTVVVLAVSVAAYFAGRNESSLGTNDSLHLAFPSIDATASATSDKFSIATGSVSEDAEGFFVLDHNSGLVQCNVIYPRSGRFMAQFTGNVAEALGSGGKGGQYIMITGRADFPRASNRPAGASILYVLDTSTGNYACYGVPFDRVAMNANRQQAGTLVLIYQGTANPLIDRDNLR